MNDLMRRSDLEGRCVGDLLGRPRRRLLVARGDGARVRHHRLVVRVLRHRRRRWRRKGGSDVGPGIVRRTGAAISKIDDTYNQGM